MDGRRERKGRGMVAADETREAEIRASVINFMAMCCTIPVSDINRRWRESRKGLFAGRRN